MTEAVLERGQLKKELYTILELNLDIDEDEAREIAVRVNKILELGEIEARNKRLKELKEKKEQQEVVLEEREEVFFKKPIRKTSSRDSYRETLE